MPRTTKAQREDDRNYQNAVDWLLSRTTLDIERTFQGIAAGWITEEDANRGVTDDGRDIEEVIAERRAAS